jgi:uncharacterized paraquat-inducible protein A
VWAVFRAPLPNRIYCPHCRERLRYAGSWPLACTAVAVMLGAVGAGFVTAEVAGVAGPAAAVVVSAALVLGGAAAEVGFVAVVWNGAYRLESVNRPKDEWDDDEAF